MLQPFSIFLVISGYHLLQKLVFVDSTKKTCFLEQSIHQSSFWLPRHFESMYEKRPASIDTSNNQMKQCQENTRREVRLLSKIQ